MENIELALRSIKIRGKEYQLKKGDYFLDRHLYYVEHLILVLVDERAEKHIKVPTRTLKSIPFDKMKKVKKNNEIRYYI